MDIETLVKDASTEDLRKIYAATGKELKSRKAASSDADDDTPTPKDKPAKKATSDGRAFGVKRKDGSLLKRKFATLVEAQACAAELGSTYTATPLE